jgi:hypothetical protein
LPNTTATVKTVRKGEKMTEQQIPKLVGSIVEHQTHFSPLPTDDAQWVIKNTKAAIEIFVLALNGQAKRAATATAKAAKKVLTPFITIATGGGTTKKLVADIRAMPTEITEYAEGMTKSSNFVISPTVGTADLVVLTVAELGFTESPRTDQFMTAEFCTRWSAENLDGQEIELCQPEDGLQLRKKWIGQPKGMAVWMAMERIRFGGDPHVFFVVRDGVGSRWLHGSWVDPGDRWFLSSRFAFRLRNLKKLVA